MAVLGSSLLLTLFVLLSIYVRPPLSDLFLASFPAAPKIIRSEKRAYRKNVGQDVKLRCRATGAHDDTNNRTLFFWKNQFGLIRQDRSRWPRYDIRQNKFLKIRNIQGEDAGVYICTATNEFGSSYAKRVLRVFKNGKEIPPVKPTRKGRPSKLFSFYIDRYVF